MFLKDCGKEMLYQKLKKKSKKSFFALIMARGGSKSIPKKNLVDLHGFPLLAWSIAACKLSKKN